MKTIIKATLTLFLSLSMLFSLQAQNCDCEESFEKTVNTYEKNYSLFQFKVTDDNRALYKAHTDIMRTEAQQAESLQECKLVLERWLDFFRDKHNYIQLKATGEDNHEKIAITETKFKSEYKKKAYGQNPLLGIWQNSGYRVAIIPNPSKNEDDFVGVVLESQSENWEKNEIKFKLSTDFGSNFQATYFMSDHSPEQLKAEQTSIEKLDFGSLRTWTKIWPESKNMTADSEVKRKYDQFHFTEVDDIPYLRFPDFYTVDAAHVDSIMKANHEKLVAADFIIVDVRDNRGGNDGVYYPILPYILDGPVEVPNSGLWMSDDNIKQFLEQSDLKGKAVEDFTEEERQLYDFVMSLKGTAFYQTEGYSSTIEADTLYSGPQKVILLATNAGSSGETFVYKANQSGKVVVYGQNTKGVVDGFNGLTTEIGCFKLTYPSSFRARDVEENPIDPYGIAPDVYVEDDTDVLRYSIEHMKQLLQNQ